MAEAANWTSDEYRSGDLPGLVALTQRNLGDVDCAQFDFAEWQYEKNPAGKPVLEMARDTADGGIVGQYVVIPISVQVNGQATLASLSLNTLTDEKFRGKGIFTKLAERVYAECGARSIAFTYGFPNTNSAPGFLKKLAFKSLGNVPMLVRPVNWRKLAEQKTGKSLVGILAGAGGGLYTAVSRPFHRLRAPSWCVLREIQKFDQRWDGFWERNCRRYPAMVSRTREYLNWRFVDIPRRRYRNWIAESAEGPLAYIVLRSTQSFGLNVGFVIDFFVDQSPKGHEAGRCLVDKAMQIFEQENVDLIGTHSLPHAVEYDLLRTCGFWALPERYLPRPTPVIVRAHLGEAGRPEAIFDMRNWYLTLGDYDAV